MINSLEEKVSFLESKLNILYTELKRMGLEIKATQPNPVECPNCKKVVQTFYEDLNTKKFVTMPNSGVMYDVSMITEKFQSIKCPDCGWMVQVRYV